MNLNLINRRKGYGGPDKYLKRYNFRLDKQGVIQVDYGCGIGIQKNPTTIAQFAIANFNKYIETNQNEYLVIFNKQINYLVDNYQIKGKDMIAYPYHFPFRTYSLKEGWYSGLAQAEIAMALIRYFSLFKDQKIESLIHSIVNFMLYPVEKGGLSTTTPEGGFWIEEYPSLPGSYVLNGFITIIFSLYEYLENFNNSDSIINTYHSCLTSLKNSLKFYIDANHNWLFYDRYLNRKVYCNFNYMELQIEQFSALYEITKEPLFIQVKEKLDKALGDMKVRVSTRKEEIINKIYEINENKCIGIYGSGEHTKKLLELTDLKVKNIRVLIDGYTSNTINHMELIQPNQIKDNELDIIIISSLANQENIYNILVNEVVYAGEIMRLYDKNDILPFYS